MMEEELHEGRHSSKKRDAIANDDDSGSDEPVKKSAKNEEKSTPNSSQSSSSSTSASEDVVFQQTLARSYERFRAAREASYRAKKRLDAQGDTVDGSGMSDKASELAREIDALKTEVAELRNKETAANKLKEDLSREICELKSEVTSLKEINIKSKNVHDAYVRVKDTQDLHFAELKSSATKTSKLNEELNRKNTALNEELEAAKERADKEVEKNLPLKKALEESRKAETAAVNREMKLLRENSAMKEDMQRKKTKAEQDINDRTNECLGLRKDLDAVRKSEKEGIDRETNLASENSALKRELEETKKKAEEDGIKDSARIKYLSHKLAQLEKGTAEEEQLKCEQPQEPIEVVAEKPQSPAAQLQPLQQQSQSQSGPDDLDSAVDSTADSSVVSKKKEKKEKKTPARLHEKGDPINIFQLCRPNTAHSISLDSALRQIRDVFGEIGTKKIGESCRNMKSDTGRLKCSACGKRIKKHRVFDHILSSEHIDIVRSRDAAVSTAALQHWLREVQQAAAATAAGDEETAAGAANDEASGEL